MKISVAMCTHNGEKFLEEQLSSIFIQSLSVHELVICDDTSRDGTVDIIQKFRQKYPDIIRLYINEKPLRTIKNFEKAVSLTTGDYIFLCDQDDVWMPHKVETMVTWMRSHRKTLMLFANGNLIDDKGEALGTTLWDHWGFNVWAKQEWADQKFAFHNLLHNRNYITGATAVINKILRDKALPIDLPNGYYHDNWFGMHAAASGGLHYLDTSLINYRIHSAQQVGVTRGKENSAVYDDQNITKDRYIRKIYKRYPHLKYKKTWLTKIKIFVYNLLHRK